MCIRDRKLTVVPSQILADAKVELAVANPTAVICAVGKALIVSCTLLLASVQLTPPLLLITNLL